MLTTDLLQYRLVGSRAIPWTISRTHAPLATRVIRTFQSAVGSKRSVLHRALEECDIDGKDVGVFRAFSKLLENRSTFIIHSVLNSEQARRAVFVAAEKLKVIRNGTPEAQKLLRSVASEFGVPVSDLQKSLYADLPGEHAFMEFRTPTAEWLIDRYNLAQAQGLLYFATRLTCRFEGNLKKIFTHLRLLELMYTLKSLPGGIFELHVDGPLSMLRMTRRYGVRMARLLPAICLARKFSVRAEIRIGNDLYQANFNERSGLVSHYMPDPVFDSRVEKTFAEKFDRLKSEWKLERESTILQAGDDILIPDFTFTSPDGKKAHLEIMGFWTPEYVERKLRKVRALRETTLLLAASTRLASADPTFPEGVIWFKGTLDPRTILERLKELYTAV